MTPKVGDVAELKLEERAIDIHVKLLEKEDSNWKGAIKSYHSKGTVTTLEERYEQIKSDEKYVNDSIGLFEKFGIALTNYHTSKILKE